MKDIYKEVIFSSEEYKEQLDYWLNILAGFPGPLDLPLDVQRLHIQSQPRERGELVVTLPEAAATRLLKFSKHTDLTLFIVLLTVLKALLYRCTRSKETLIVTPLLKLDDEADTQKSYNKRVLLRDPVNTALTFKQLLVETKNRTLEAFKNQDYPLELVLKRLGLNIKDHTFLDRVVLLLKNIHHAREVQDLEYDLLFSFERAGSCITADINYNAHLFKKETIEALVQRYIRLLESGAADINTQVKDLETLSREEKQQILVDFNCTSSGYPDDKTIHQLFEEQVEQTPDQIAVVGPLQIKYRTNMTYRTYISYRELNEKSNQLAWYLRKKGISADDIVGIMMDDSIEMIVGILGVLKAGAAYLPIHPHTPGNRILSMLNDSNAVILLTKKDILRHLPFAAFQGSYALEDVGITPVITPCRAQVEDLDSLQIPDRSLIDYEKYRPYIGQAMVQNSITIHMSRGCVFNCAYCFKIWPRKYVIRSAENIFDEIYTYYKMGIRRFAFVDDLPNFNIEVSSKVYRLIIDHGLKVHLHYPNGIRGDILTKEYIDLMVKAGTVNMDLALETTSPRLQKLLRKNLNIQRLKENIQYIARTYPHVILELQILHGIPSETEEEARDSLEFIKNIKWIDFPYIHILKIGFNSDMARIAMEHGISREAIARSAEMFIHELPDTLPFPKSFTKAYKSDFVNRYFMNKQRLIQRLPWQMKSLTEEELVQKYNNYLPMEINTFDDLLNYAGINRDQVIGEFLPADFGLVPELNDKLRAHFPSHAPCSDAFKLLLLDLSQHFTKDSDLVYDPVEPPLGLLYLLTHLNRTFGDRINGKIAKSKIDFDSYDELKTLVEEFRPEMIGIRTLNSYNDFFHQTVSLLRQWGIEVPIIAGGPYATSNYTALLKDTNIDLAVVGEGELTLAELMEKILANGGKMPSQEVLKDIKGLAFIDQKEKKQLAYLNREIILLDRISQIIRQESRQNLPAGNQAADLAYIIYTSGSTGVPKGVLVRHNNLVNQVHGLVRRFELDASLNYLLLASFTFDVSIMHIFSPLTTGAKFFLLDDDIRKDAVKLWRFVQENNINILNIVPAYMNILLQYMEISRMHLKYLFVGGDVFGKELYTRLRQTFAADSIINIYGPTETTINATLYPCRNKELENCDTIPIGKPLANYKMYILDRDLNPVPIGIKGELYISGEGLARGYLNRPELTAERFVSFFDNRSYRSYRSYISKRIYRTGDLARWLPDGNIEFIGRVDSQVKVRGFRVELGEIQHQLRQHVGIKEAVVITRENDDEPSLCAYFVPHTPGFNTSELRDYLSKELPDYMVPTYFVEVEKIPMTSSGKVNRQALPDPVPGGIDAEYTAPRYALEKKLAQIWSGVVGMDKQQIGIDTNFFELGGHSLKATILGAKIHKELNVKIPILEIFRLPTIRLLAEYITNNSEKANKYCSIKAVEMKTYYPLSSAQKRMYILNQLEEQSVSYNMPSFVTVEGAVEEEKFAAAFRKLIRRQEALRTRFIVVNGEPVQKIEKTVDFETRFYQVEVEAKVEEMISNFIRPFDLSRAPLLRVGFIKLPHTPAALRGHPSQEGKEHQHILLVDMHHIIGDGISMIVLIREFTQLYQGEVIPALSVQYKDYTIWQQGLVESGELKRQEEYWLKQLNVNIPPLHLPLDYPRPAMMSFEGRWTDFEISPETTAALKKLAEENEATLYMVLLAAYNVLLHKYTGQETILVGSAIAGRSHPDLQDIIGVFLNTLAIKTKLSEGMTFVRFLGQVKENTLQAYENQDYQFEELVEKLDYKRDYSRNPLFDTMLNFLGMDIPEIKIGDLKLTPYKMENRAVKFDIKINAGEQDGILYCTLDYCTKLFRAETMDTFIDNFLKIIEIIVENPGIKLADIQLISEEVKKEMIDDFSEELQYEF